MGVLDPPAKPPLLRGQSIAFMGDSITAGSIGLYNYGDAFPLYAVLASQGKLVNVGFHGVGGETTTQMLTRLSAALTKRPRYLHILGGTNDVGQGLQTAQTDTQIVTTVSTNLTTMCRQTTAAGAIPILGTIPPANTSGDRHRVNLKCNIWIRRYAIANGYPLIDYYTLLAKDGISETPAGNQKTLYAQDGIHFNAKGAGAMGNLLAQSLASVAYSYNPPLVTDLADNSQQIYLATNTLFQGDTARPGVAPDTYSALGAAFTDAQTVYSLVTDAQVPGEMQQIALSTAATNLGGISGTTAATTTAGNIVAFGGYFTTDGNVGVQAQVIIGATTYKAMNIAAGTAITRGIYYMEFPAPATGTISVQLLTGAPTGTAATVQFSYPTVIDLTAAIGETTALNAN